MNNMLHVKVAFRSIKRNPLTALISLLGLSLGFSCFLLIIHYLDYENSYDTFHASHGRIYRIIQENEEENGIRRIASIGPQIGIQGEQQLPEIEDMTRIIVLGRFTLGNDLAVRDYESIWVVDTGFFDFFTFPMVKGQGKAALNTPNGLLLSERLARKHFQGSLPVLGDSIWTNAFPAQVSGVFKNIPKQSHLQFDMILPENVAASNFSWWNDFMNNNWDDNSFVTYIKLQKSADPSETAAKLTRLAREHFPDDKRSSVSFHLQPLNDIHFHDKGIEGSLASNPSETFYVYLLSVLGMMVLVVAIFNYSNLSTAGALRRTREIGLRKSVGAGKYQIIGQFMIESMLLCGLSLLLSLFLTDLILPTFNSLMDTEIVLDLSNVKIWLLFIGIVFLTGVIASLYPTLVISRVSPAVAMKNQFSVRHHRFSFRKIMVIAQFAVAIIMISCTLVVYQQLNYLESLNLGFDLEPLVVIDINSGNLRDNAESMKAEMEALPGVSAATVSSRVPGEWKVVPIVTVFSGNRLEGQDMNYIGVDEQFITTYDIQLVTGTNFSGNPSDSTKVLLNQSAVEALQLENPVGTIVEIPRVNWSGDSEELENPFRAMVTGVVADFYFETFRQPIRPMVLAYSNNPIHSIDYFTVSVKGDHTAGTIASLKEINNRFDSENPMEYNFLDEKFGRFVSTDQQRGQVFLLFSVITILISCMGLFALAAYEIRMRMKELGIRKVLGASFRQIMMLLLGNFAIFIGIAFVLAMPVSWLIASRWLEDFAYRMHLNWIFYILPVLLALLLAGITILFLTIKAARTQPAITIRQD